MKKIRKSLPRFVGLVSLCLLSWLAQADVSQQVNELQVDVNAIERDLSQLEKDLLFPPLTRIEVFVSLSKNVNFTPKSISLSVDGEEKTLHLYSQQDVAALRLGGLQNLWEGNVALGSHAISAKFIGVDVKGDKVEGTASLDFEKTRDGRSFELAITELNADKAPKFAVKDWGN